LNNFGRYKSHRNSKFYFNRDKIFLTHKISIVKKIYTLLLLLVSSSALTQSVRLLKYIDEGIVFTNAIKVENQIFLGSQEGVYRLSGTDIVLVEGQIKGFIERDQRKGGFSKVDKARVSFVRPNHFILDQIPKDYRYDISVISKENQMVVVASGKLFLFEALPFSKHLKGVSIRSISPTIISTYVGAFSTSTFTNILNEEPGYANGYTRDFDGKTFVCFDGLAVYENGVNIANFSYFNEELLPEFSVANEGLGFILDIQIISGQRYLIATTDGVYTFDYERQTAELIEQNVQGINPVLIVQNEPLQKGERLLWYAINGRIKGYNFPRILGTNDLVVYEHEAPINDGTVNIFDDGFISPNFYLTAEDGVYRVTYSKKDKVEILSKEIFKTIRSVNDSTLALTNDFGLYRYDLKSRNMQLVVAEEFNRMALEVINDTLYAGSINGLYKFSLSNFLKFSTSPKRLSMNELFKYLWRFRDFIYLAVALLILRYMLQKERSKDKVKSKSEIEGYIATNLSMVTVADLMNEFKLSYNSLNSLLKPLTAAQFIRETRKQTIRGLKEQGLSITEIAEKTGYNTQYLQKIIREKSANK
jgi:AraC-like DNA-binding protein